MADAATKTPRTAQLPTVTPQVSSGSVVRPLKSRSKFKVKGIVFNLLESAAREAGCSREAWDVVVEFAAAEAMLNGDEVFGRAAAADDVELTRLFEVPVEAVLRCFAHGSDGLDAPSMDLIDAETQAEWFGSFDLPDLMPSYYDAFPKQPRTGFGPSAFSEIDSGWDGDGDVNDEADADGFDLWPLLSRK